MKRVIIESPYAGRGNNFITRTIDRFLNVRYARKALRHSLSLDEAPIASHLLYTQPGVLNDNIKEERDWGIEAGLEWRSVAEKTVVYADRGITTGMKYGIEKAKNDGIEVEYRHLPVEPAPYINLR